MEPRPVTRVAKVSVTVFTALCIAVGAFIGGAMGATLLESILIAIGATVAIYAAFTIIVLGLAAAVMTVLRDTDHD